MRREIDPVDMANAFGRRPGAETVAEPLPTMADLRTPAVIAGTVADEKGNFITEASIVLTGDDQPVQSTWPGLRGEFRLWLQPTNRLYSLRVNAGDLSLTLTNFNVRPGTTNLDLIVRRFASLAGKVTAHDGSPLEGVVVQVVSDTQPIEVGFDGFQGEYFSFAAPQGGARRFPELPPDRSPVRPPLGPCPPATP